MICIKKINLIEDHVQLNMFSFVKIHGTCSVYGLKGPTLMGTVISNFMVYLF